ncbi:MAG: hypothetical protein FWD04_06190 [Conexibacteraceae bacterium]|nr:hypothetical protein [Conexibacteraceae bacterium]
MGTTAWILGVAALIALMFAGGEIIIVPVAAFAVIAAGAWYVMFHWMGLDREGQGASGGPRELRTRSREETARELGVNHLNGGELPGGAEGGDESPSAHRLALPCRDGTPWGDTDQHSSSQRLPLARR